MATSVCRQGHYLACYTLEVMLGPRGERQLLAVCSPSGGEWHPCIAISDPAAPTRTPLNRVTFALTEKVLVGLRGELKQRATIVIGGSLSFNKTVEVTTFRRADLKCVALTAPKDFGVAGLRLRGEPSCSTSL